MVWFILVNFQMENYSNTLQLYLRFGCFIHILPHSLTSLLLQDRSYLQSVQQNKSFHLCIPRNICPMALNSPNVYTLKTGHIPQTTISYRRHFR